MLTNKMPTVNTSKVSKMKMGRKQDSFSGILLQEIISAFFTLRFGQIIPQDLEVFVKDIILSSEQFIYSPTVEKSLNTSLKSVMISLKKQAQEELFKRYLKPMDITEVIRVYGAVRHKVLTHESFIVKSKHSSQIYRNISGIRTLLALNVYELVFPLTQFADQSMYDVLRAIVSTSSTYRELTSGIIFLEGIKQISLSPLLKDYIFALLKEHSLLGPFKYEITEDILLVQQRKELFQFASTLAVPEFLISQRNEVEKNMNDALNEFESLFDDFSKTPDRIQVRNNFSKEIKAILLKV